MLGGSRSKPPMANNQTRESLNPKRTPAEMAAFKRANVLNRAAKTVHVIDVERMHNAKFRVSFETPNGRFGWLQITGDDGPSDWPCTDEIIDEFNLQRQIGAIPRDAQITQVQRIRG